MRANTPAYTKKTARDVQTATQIAQGMQDDSILPMPPSLEGGTKC